MQIFLESFLVHRRTEALGSNVAFVGPSASLRPRGSARLDAQWVESQAAVIRRDFGDWHQSDPVELQQTAASNPYMLLS